MTYIEPEIGDDEATIRTQITDAIQSAVPGWLPVRGGLLYVLAVAFAFVVAEFYGRLRLISRTIFSVFLREMAGVPVEAATPSTVMSTWTSTLDLSFTVEAGTLVGIEDGAGGLVAFEVVADVSTTDGSAENVELVSQEAGEFTAGLTGPVVLLDAAVAAALEPTITLEAVSSPVTLATSAAGDDIIDTATAHGFVADDVVRFPTLTGGSGLTAATVDYFVIAANLAAQTFQVSTTQGGAAVNFTTNITAGTVVKVAAVATADGTDGETADKHRSRGSERLTLFGESVITGEDAAVLARQDPGVWRAMAVDNYDVATDDDTAEGKIAVALQAEDGGAVSGTVKTRVGDLIAAATILNLAAGLADPDPTGVDARWDFVPHDGWDPADVKARAEAAVEAFLASHLWGGLPFGDQRVWRPLPTVHLFDIAQVILAVEGLDRIVTGTLEIRESGGSWGTTDVTLGTKPWSIAEPGTVTATAVS